MNITLLANKDLASCLAINYLLPELAEHRLSVFLSSRVGSSKLAPPLEQMRFVEQDLLNEVLFPLLSRQGEMTTELIGFPGIRSRLEDRLCELNNINSKLGLAQLSATEPELVLSIRYGSILKDAAISIPQHGVLNLHSGRLPDYKGVMATFWALLNEEQFIGTTLHTIDDRCIDTGRIVAETTFAVQKEHSYLWHVLALYREGCQIISRAVQTIASGSMPKATRQSDAGRYFSFPTAADLERFSARGWHLFDSEDLLTVYKRFLPTGS
ncbi:MAG: formyl transferase [Gammaproteobacteria bacterium]|nr:formyl transferase [Gammaproteobacteria bacterium]MCY4356316.1 formyl transferase [Gammaproteobacteria bacterium]